MLKGIDVSVHQGVVDWAKVKNTDISFAILRAGYGMYESQKDSTFERNYSECKRLGIPVGVYWYSYATNTSQVLREATICLNVIKGKTFECGVWFDQEYEPGIKTLTKQTRTNLCISFIEKIISSGYKCGLYCSGDWIKNWVEPKQLKKYDKWIAQYSSKCGYNGDDLAMWQYTSKAIVDGINGYIDMNYLYKDYFSVDKDKETGVWKKNLKGWWYEYSDKTYPINKWLKIDGLWYWFDEKGYAVKGFKSINNKNYYFAETSFDNIKECQLLMTDENGVLV